MSRYAIIVAGGKGTRMGYDLPKQFIRVGDRPVLMHTIARFHEFDAQMPIIVVLPSDQQAYWHTLCGQYRFGVPHQIANGGATRFESSRNGLQMIPQGEEGLVAIHDGARPFVSQETIARCFAAAQEQGGCIPVMPVTDTLRKRTEDGGNVTVDRSLYCQVQTPQVFDIKRLRDAYAQPYRPEYTDDASVFEYSGCNKVALVDGNRENIKITTPFDLQLAEALLDKNSQL